MATKKVDVSTNRMTYGFPGADLPDLDSAIDVAKVRFREMKEKYGDKLIEGWDRAIQKEDTSVWLSLHIKVDS